MAMSASPSKIDWLADTMVVVDRPQRWIAPASAGPADAHLLAQLPKRIALPPGERRTLDAIIARLGSVGRARMTEITAEYAAQLAQRLGVVGPVEPLALLTAVHARIHARHVPGLGARN